VVAVVAVVETAVVVAAVVSAAVTTAVVAIGAVAAEGHNAELVASVTTEVSGDSQPLPANSNSRAARGTGEVAQTTTEPPRPTVTVPSELVSLANEIGQTWSQAYVRTLQDQERDIVGAWPGTIREARRQVLARIKAKLEPEQLDQLARITNLAARRGWETVSEPDLES
jgi:hypothetical protein